VIIFPGTTKKSVFDLPTRADHIVLYQKNIEAVCSSEAEVRQEIRLTGTRLSYNRSVSSQLPVPHTTRRDLNCGALLRRWRTVRRVSQLELALDADISTRHLSCVETGRAQPSREMVLRLADALQIPLRERNTLLLAAGYAPHYRQTRLDAPEMEAARQAVDLLLRQQEPYPGIVIDRYWNTLRMNSGMRHFLGRFPICDSVKPHNGVRFVFHPKGLRPFIENWESVAARIIQRVHREVAANPSDETMKCFLEELVGYPDVPSRWHVLDVDGPPPPFLTLNYRWKSSMLRFFSTFTTFGSPQDVALQEMRIESFFPADEATRAELMAAQ
jgi:transcriptional regulator with XRE-family HTH domain